MQDDCRRIMFRSASGKSSGGLVGKQRLVPIRHTWAYERNKQGKQGFRVLGIAAKDAVPSLLSLLNDPTRFVKESAAAALKAIDPEAAAKAGVR